jgi:hypothetical protein
MRQRLFRQVPRQKRDFLVDSQHWHMFRGRVEFFSRQA